MENTIDLDFGWSHAKKIAFRFIFTFFTLFIIIENNGAYPLWGWVMKYPEELLHLIVPWIGKHLLHLPYEITVFTNGSGDTTYDYVIVLSILVIATVVTMVWSALDRRRANYTVLYYWLTVAIRFYVALMLINYGLVKVIKLQFPAPGFFRLTQNYGDSSPMGLAWTFLGFSDGYNFFMGVAELAAVLLVFRRTMTVGAIVTLMTTANVMAVNYFYDVPVKIISTALVMMTLFLLLNDAGRLLRFFFTGEAVALPVIPAPVVKKKGLRIVKWSVKFLVIAYALGYGAFETLNYKKQWLGAPKLKLYGLYDIDTFVIKHDTLLPLITDSIRWRQFVMEYEGYAKVRYMNDHSDGFLVKQDTLLKKMELTRRDDSSIKHAFNYQTVASDRFLLTGEIHGDSVFILMKRRKAEDFKLINRGFHWINETPFNK